MNVDQHGFSNQPSEFMSGAEAAAMLGVKRETLYAYASRGLVRSEPGDGGKARRYRRSDIERLQVRRDARSGHGPVAASALRWGEPVLESAISSIREGGLFYRGLSAVELAESGASFESVVDLLWSAEGATSSAQDGARSGDSTGSMGTARPTRSSRADPLSLPRARTRVDEAGFGVRPEALAALLPRGTPALPSLALVTAAMAARDLERFHAPHDTEIERARRLTRCLAAALCLGVDPKRSTAALAADSVAGAVLVALGARPTAAAIKAVNAALILSADHELNTSTFAVRVTASAGADLYACVSAGLAALSGPEHGGVCDRIEALIAEAGRPERARAVVQERSRRGESIPGFGHKLYPDGDPRARPLLAAASTLAPQRVAVRTLLAIADAMHKAGREPPSVDTALVALTAALGAAPGSAAGLFAVGRSAGWIAHVMEQREAAFMVRPRARYIGP